MSLVESNQSKVEATSSANGTTSAKANETSLISTPCSDKNEANETKRSNEANETSSKPFYFSDEDL